MISAVEVLAIHDRLISTTGGAYGIRDEGALLSALHPTIYDRAGALLQALCVNHPFVDGNKRTALAAAVYLLHEDRIELDIPVDEGESFMLRVAQGFVDVDEAVSQLRSWATT